MHSDIPVLSPGANYLLSEEVSEEETSGEDEYPTHMQYIYTINIKVKIWLMVI
jgi:hypothetical protein